MGKTRSLACTVVALLALGGIHAAAQGFGGWFGDGRDLIGVLRPGSMHWFLTTLTGTCPIGFQLLQNSDRTLLCRVQFGLPGIGDVPLPGSYSRPGVRELGVLRMLEGRLYFQPADGRTCPPGSTDLGQLQSGAEYCSLRTVVGPRMTPLSMDSKYRRSIVGAYDPDHNRFVLPAPCREGWTESGSECTFKFGARGYVPYFLDYDGDGNDDLALYNPSSALFYFLLPGSQSCPRSATTQPDVNGLTRCRVPAIGQVPLTPGHYDGDSIADVIGYDVGRHRFALVPTTGSCPPEFETRGTDSLHRTVCFRNLGGEDDIAVAPAGDYDNDGLVDLAVVNQLTYVWTLAVSSGICPSTTSAQSQSGLPVCTRQFGLPDDIPID